MINIDFLLRFSRRRHKPSRYTRPCGIQHSVLGLDRNVPNSIATSFGNVVVSGMSYSKTESLPLATLLGAYEFVILIVVIYLSIKTNQRLLWCILAHIPSTVGTILMVTTEKAVALIGYYLCSGIPIRWTIILGLTRTNMAGLDKEDHRFLHSIYCV